MANKKKNKNTNKEEEMDKTRVYKIKKKKTKFKKIFKRIILTLLVLGIIGAGIAAGIIYNIAKEAKIDVQDLALKYENSVVKDIEGDTIAVLSGNENREFISISDMAEYLPVAFVSIEDERFYEHNGVDIKRTIGATAKYALSKIGIGSSNYGGSTITQQVIKNATEEKDRTWQRKVKEIARAYYVEQELSKDQILELYLNLIFMGGNTNIYGVEVAANYYFSKSASELNLAECAFLAGINNEPNSYDPFVEDEERRERNLEKIKNRAKIVLNKMNELGKIKTQEEYNQAIEEVNQGIVFTKGTIVENIYSYHTDAAINQIINQLMKEKELNRNAAELYLYGGGFTIYTTQNTKIQNIMNEEAKKEKYIKNAKNQEGATSQAGMVLLDHETGYVLGVIGGLGEKTTSMGFNRGTQLVKQTGSSMKPIAVVAPGIEKGLFTAATVYDDTPFKIYKNYNHYKGLLTIRYAIESSQNIPMVKAMQVLGPQNSIKFLRDLGITKLDDKEDNNLGLALGGLYKGTSPLEMAAAYATIANNGVYIEPTFYTKVVDGDGNTILEPKQESRTVMSSATSYILKEVLTQPVKGKEGTAKNCYISGMSVAAKTGTTNNDYDRWLCGFTPYYTAATWYGYDDNETVSGWGTSPASQIWIGVMRPAHEGLQGKTFASTRPNGIVTATVCRDSGLLATEECKTDPREDRSYTEYFVKGTVPNKQCDCHVKAELCTESGLIATEFCPEKEEKVFITRPNYEADKTWERAKDAEFMLTIKDTCTVHTKSADTTKPVIKLKGENPMTIELNSEYKEPKATATDDVDGDITETIIISGKVDTKRAGKYTITYTVSDKAGNSDTVERTVIVKEKKVEEDKEEPKDEDKPNTKPNEGNNNNNNNEQTSKPNENTTNTETPNQNTTNTQTPSVA